MSWFAVCRGLERQSDIKADVSSIEEQLLKTIMEVGVKERFERHYSEEIW
jgi:hypothetical protein